MSCKIKAISLALNVRMCISLKYES